MARRPSRSTARRHRGPIVLPSDIVRAFREQADVDLRAPLAPVPPPSPAAPRPAVRSPMFVLLDRGHRALEVPELFGCIREARKALRWQQPRRNPRDGTPEVNGSTYDCDDFSLALKSFFARIALERRSELPYCLGVVGCRWWDDATGAYHPHVLCWALTSEANALRLWFVDPQRGIRWDSDNWLTRARNLVDPRATSTDGHRRYVDHFLVMV